VPTSLLVAGRYRLVDVLTGAPPYQADSAVAVAAQHVHAPVPSVRQARPDVTPALDGLVRDLLAKDPGYRPQRAADALARIRALQTIPATVPTLANLDVTTPIAVLPDPAAKTEATTELASPPRLPMPIRAPERKPPPSPRAADAGA
jgi:serine/threonine-protein kinase